MESRFKKEVSSNIPAKIKTKGDAWVVKQKLVDSLACDIREILSQSNVDTDLVNSLELGVHQLINLFVHYARQTIK